MNTTLLYGILIVLAGTPIILSSISHFRQQKMLQEQMEQRKTYLASLKAGDEVLLLSGIHGKIISMVTLQIAKNVTIYVEKESIMGKTKEQGQKFPTSD